MMTFFPNEYPTVKISCVILVSNMDLFRYQAEERHGSIKEHLLSIEQNLADRELELQRVKCLFCWEWRIPRLSALL